jgi:hypothetical protein
VVAAYNPLEKCTGRPPSDNRYDGDVVIKLNATGKVVRTTAQLEGSGSS